MKRLLKKDRMTNSQKKIFFNLEIRVANDLLMANSKRLNFMFETVTPHSRTPV